jgi:hypothetical protein
VETEDAEYWAVEQQLELQQELRELLDKEAQGVREDQQWRRCDRWEKEYEQQEKKNEERRKRVAEKQQRREAALRAECEDSSKFNSDGESALEKFMANITGNDSSSDSDGSAPDSDGADCDSDSAESDIFGSRGEDDFVFGYDRICADDAFSFQLFRWRRDEEHVDVD